MASGPKSPLPAGERAGPAAKRWEGGASWRALAPILASFGRLSLSRAGRGVLRDQGRRRVHLSGQLGLAFLGQHLAVQRHRRADPHRVEQMVALLVVRVGMDEDAEPAM